MRAAVVPAFGQPLVIEDRPVPEPGPGQVVVRMEASGLCHTDLERRNPPPVSAPGGGFRYLSRT
jgi:D-arabinose 1-dehydrogenase-like Zn-dependent alcohol dehydrogenase